MVLRRILGLFLFQVKREAQSKSRKLSTSLTTELKARDGSPLQRTPDLAGKRLKENMSGGRSSRWDTIKNVQTALRPPHSGRDEGQSRGMERRREDHPPPALDPPPPPPGRPAYGYPQHYPSDPGPHSGLYNSPPASAQGSPPLLHSQHYQGQFQAGSSQQGYIAPPHPGSYQYIHSQAYGQNQGYISPPPPASNPPPHPNYQQQPTPSANQSYQGGQGRQGAYPYSHSQTTYPRASNYYPPPPPPSR